MYIQQIALTKRSLPRVSGMRWGFQTALLRNPKPFLARIHKYLLGISWVQTLLEYQQLECTEDFQGPDSS